MRALIAAVIAFSLVVPPALAQTGAPPGDALLAPTCKLYFESPGLCQSPPGQPAAEITKAYVIADPDQVFFLRVYENRGYLSPEKGAASRVTPENLDSTLDREFKSKDRASRDVLSIDCVAERKTCGRPSPVVDEDCCGAGAPKETIAAPTGLGEIVEATACSAEEAAAKKAQKCWTGASVLKGAGSCVAEMLWGVVKSVLDMVKFIYNVGEWVLVAPVRGFDWVFGTDYAVEVKETLDAPLKYIESWWAATEESENRSSDAMAVAARADSETLKKSVEAMKEGKIEGPGDLSPGLIQRFSDFLTSAITENFGCQKWSGTPHARGSRCVEPWKGADCADCWTKMNMVCGVVGSLAGQIPAGKLFASFLQYFIKGVTPVLNLTGRVSNAIQAQLSKVTKVPPLSEYSVWEKAVGQVIAVATRVGDGLQKGMDFTVNLALAPLRATARWVHNKVPPELVGSLGSAILQAPSRAMKWYYGKLQLEVAETAGGQLKRAAVYREQLAAKVEVLKNEVKAAKKGDTIASGSAKKRLAKTELELEEAATRLDVLELQALPAQFAKVRIAEQTKIAKKLGKKLTAAEKQKIITQANAAAAEEQAKNFQIAYRGIETINAAPLASAVEIEAKLAPVLHESWRASRVASPQVIDDWIIQESARRLEMAAAERELFEQISSKARAGEYPKYLPRIKPASASKFKEGDGAIDIANHDFDSLTPYWQGDNQKASKTIVTALFKLKKDGKVVSPVYEGIRAGCSGGCANDLDGIANIYKRIGSQRPVDRDPLVVAGAREFKKWTERTGTSYTRESELGIVFETVNDLNDKSQSAADIKSTIIQPGNGRGRSQ